MLINFVITIVCNDKPGVVETIANAVSHNQGSWLESSFSLLAGKFAGVVRIQVEEQHQEELMSSLKALETEGLHIRIELCKEQKPETQENVIAKFSAVGPDRKGIVREFSQAFTEYGINIDEMDTRLSSMPYSGEPLFEAEGAISIPKSVDVHELEEKLLKIADILGLDFSLNRDNL